MRLVVQKGLVFAIGKAIQQAFCLRRAAGRTRKPHRQRKAALRRQKKAAKVIQKRKANVNK